MFLHYITARQNSFVICDEGQKKAFLREIFKNNNLALEELAEASRFINLAKRKLLFSDKPNFARQVAENFSFKLKTKEDSFIEVYCAYEKLLLASNRVDFDDLLVLPLRLLREQAVVREYVRTRWKYLLIDEYQDIDAVQEQIIEQFANQGVILTAVGDDSQSIYGFRGADIGNILHFPKKYPNVKQVLLEQNYRSTPAILALANAVINRNRSQFPKKLFAQGEHSGHKPRYLAFKSDLEEADWVAQDIINWRKEGTALAGIAIFYRTNYQSRIIEEQLVRLQVPYRVVKGFRFYERKEIKEVLAYLHFLSNTKDQPAFAACVNMPKRAIGAQTLKLIQDFVLAKRSPDILAALASKELRETLSKRVQIALAEFVDLLEQCQTQLAGTTLSLNALIERIVHKSGLWKHYQGLTDKFEREQRLGSLKQLIYSGIDFAAEYSTHFANEQPTPPLSAILAAFLENISLAGTEQPEEKDDVVNLLTVHNAKGLEYPIVYVMGMEEGTFPHFLSLGDISQIEEERRLFYVAVTRAMVQLYLSSAQIKQVRGEFDFFTVSRFLEEIPFTCLHAKSSSLKAEN